MGLGERHGSTDETGRPWPSRLNRPGDEICAAAGGGDPDFGACRNSRRGASRRQSVGWHLEVEVLRSRRRRERRTEARARGAPRRLPRLRARWAHVCAIRRRRPRGSRRRPAYGCGARATAQVRVAYGGTYTIASDKVIHHIDIAWNNARFGSDQVRFFNLDGEKLTLTTERNKSPIDGSEGFGVLEFEQ